MSRAYDDDDPITEMDLLAYVDGHLDPARQAAVERHLARTPEDARRVAADLAINDGIRRLFHRPFQELPPDPLTRLLRAPPSRRGFLKPLKMMAAAGILVVAGAAGGFWLGAGQGTQPLPGVEPLASGVLTPAAVGAKGGIGEPIVWLGERLKRSIRSPQLQALGFDLLRQDLVGNPSRPSVQLTYGDKRGRHVELFMQARWDGMKDQQYRYRESGGRGVLYWADGPLVYALTGDLTADQLRLLADQITPGDGRGDNRAADRPAALAPGMMLAVPNPASAQAPEGR